MVILKKLIQLAVITLVLVLSTPLIALAAGFNDVTTGNTFYEEIEALSSEGIISGYSDGTFKPNHTVTRAQAAVMIGKALGLSEELKKTNFTDVHADVTGAGYIASAVDESFSGFPDGTFRTVMHL